MRTFFLSCVLLLLLAIPAHAKLLSADQVREPQSLLPYCTWLPDPEMRHSIASVTSGASPERFAPLRGGLSLRGSGPVWVRLVLVKSATTEMPLVINLGDLPPGKTTVYFAQSSGQLGETPGENWRSVDVSSHENIPLPEPGLLPESVYIHMEEMPGLWFTPMVSAQNAAPSGMRFSAIILPVVLVLALGLCLLKGIKEQVQWALWAALYLLFALVSAVFTVPGAHYAFGFLSLPVLLAPGLALILLPHVGRCMFRTPGESLVQDTILYFCSFLGMVVALAPLFPGMGWLTRLFPLWPIVLLPLLPLCLGAIVMKRPGAFAYTGACLFPVLGAVASLAVMRSPSPHPFAAEGGLWGVALGGLGLVLARVPKYIPAVHEVDDEFMEPELAGLSLAESAVGSARAKAADSGLELDETEAFRKHSQYEDLPPLQVQTLSGAHQASSELSFGGFDGIRPTGAEDGPVLSGGTGMMEQASEAGHAPAGLPHDAMAPEYAKDGVAYVPGDVPGDVSGDLPDDVFGAAHDDARAERSESADVAWGSGSHATPAERDARGGYDEPQEQEHDALQKHEALAPAAAASAAFGRVESVSDGMDEEHHELAATDMQPVAQPATQHEQSYPQADAATQGRGEGFTAAATYTLSGQADQAYYGGETARPSDTDDQLLSLVEEDTPSFSLPPQAPSLGADILGDDDERMAARTAFPTQTGFVFNLHALVRGVHDIVAPLAKNKGIIFSWFISPSLPPLLEGDAPRLRGALTLLLQNAVQATRRGSVQLAVRKNPGATERGDLLFAVSDSGSVQRTDAGFFHAWEMAARTGGVFNVEYSPNSGTQITFTVRFGLPSRQEAMAAGLGSPAVGPAGAPTFLSSQERDAEALARSAMHEAQRTDAQAAQAAASAFAYPAEDPRLAAMTP
ncbi:hypothetical protein LJC46_08875, partial [Desulfovibrio sp. OttesenSCG-928-G15]|nr:hypothetical protein [Desulfovibrio sp. OttesenSCG-928-G15]